MGREPEPQCSHQSSPPGWAGLAGGFGQVLAAATCSFFLNPTADSPGARVAAVRKQLSLLLAPSPRVLLMGTGVPLPPALGGKPQKSSLLHSIPSPEGVWLPNPCLESPGCSHCREPQLGVLPQPSCWQGLGMGLALL